LALALSFKEDIRFYKMKTRMKEIPRRKNSISMKVHTVEKESLTNCSTACLGGRRWKKEER
jgi:hypothetical protein